VFKKQKEKSKEVDIPDECFFDNYEVDVLIAGDADYVRLVDD